MAFNYLKAHQRMIRQAVKDRGGDFGALYDISRWHHLTPAESQKLADEVGITLSEAERVELRERWEEAERLDALALGRETRKAEELPVRWVAENQEHEPRERQAVVVVKKVEPLKIKMGPMITIGLDGLPGRLVATKDKAVAVATDGTETPFEFPKRETPVSPVVKRIDFNRKKT